jgi:protein-S-isoprenylcysteine O-methyltransferase Ste14
MTENPLVSPWFWAFLAAIGWGMGIGLVGTKRLGRKLTFGVIMFILAEVPRILIPMGFIPQPRIMPVPTWLVIVGWIIFAGSFIFAAPVIHIVPLTAPDQSEPLRTTGLYSIVRHPLMLCDILWPLGWSLIFGSIIGILLFPAWTLIIWVLTNVEDEALVREYGDVYRDFQSRTPRLFPHLPHFGN